MGDGEPSGLKIYAPDAFQQFTTFNQFLS